MLGRRCASRCRSPAEAVRLPLLSLSLSLLLLPPPAAANLATLEQIVACNTATLALKGDARCGGEAMEHCDRNTGVCAEGCQVRARRFPFALPRLPPAAHARRCCCSGSRRRTRCTSRAAGCACS